MKIIFLPFLLPKKKTLLIVLMKTFLAICFLTTFGFTSKAVFSQDTKIIIKSDKIVPIEEVFDLLKVQTTHTFIYSIDLFDTMPKISLKKGKTTVGQLLESTVSKLGYTVEYEEDGTILVFGSGIIPDTYIVEQEQSTVSGIVTDPTGMPIPGVNIMEKGTSNGTVTNFDGQYTIDISPEAVLVFSYLGYEAVEIEVDGQTQLNISMEHDSSALEEVVLVGYGEKEKGELTGSISTLDGESLERTSQANLTQALQGKVPGLIVNNRGGIPGSNDAAILVRGTSTLGNNSPLIIIDGVPRESFANLSANSIESISVLKDAAAAIYGARAANGVILIKTKRGTEGQHVISLTSSYGVSSFTGMPEYMSSFQYATWENEIAERYGRAVQWSDEDLQLFENGTSPLTHPNTDFFEEIFRDFAPQTHHSLSASGGSERIQYFINGDYLHQDGLYESDDLNYDQYQIRSNIDAEVTKDLTFGFDLAGRLEEQHSTARPVSALMPYWAYPYSTAWYPNGLPGIGSAEGQNPVIISSDDAGWTESKDKIFQSKISFGLELDWITDGLALNGYGAFDYNVNTGETFNNIWTVYQFDETTEEFVPQTGQDQNVGRTRALNQNTDIESSRLYHLRMNYDRSFGDHDFSAFIAYEQQEETWETLRGYRRDLISEDKIELFTGGPYQLTNFGSSSETGRVNYFGSLSYNYMRKYLLDFTLRRDGSFNFSEGKRFGTFPGVSVAWNMAKESFMESTNDWLTDLKVRASWAKLGNDRIPAFQYLTQYELNSYYIYGESPYRVDGFGITNTGNPNVTWEISKNKNFGIDAVLLNGDLSMTVEYFHEKRSQILITRNESVPAYTGLELPPENLGRVDNKGLEFVLDYQEKVGDFSYNIGGNLTYHKNKIIFMDEPENTPPYRAQEGHPLGSWVVYVTDGLYNSLEEINNSTHLEGTKPGDIKYVDVNGDGEISGDDQVRKFSSPIPETQFGFYIGMNYKGFDFNAVFTGQAGAETMLLLDNIGNKPEYLFKQRWTENNKSAAYPRAYERFDRYNTLVSDFWLYDASFIRLNNVELAYNFPANWLSEIRIEGFRLYVRGTNLFTTNKIEGQFDPEVTSRLGTYYPQQRTITTGINIIL